MESHETEFLTSRARITDTKAWGFAALATIFFAVSIIFLSASILMPMLILFIFIFAIGGLKLLDMANESQSLARLYRRVARIGIVDRYLADTRPKGDWSFWINRTSNIENSYDDPPGFHNDWSADERFEERMARIVGHRPAYIETPTNDPVVVFAEDKPVRNAVTHRNTYLINAEPAAGSS